MTRLRLTSAREASDERNPKLEGRNPKEGRNSKAETGMLGGVAWLNGCKVTRGQRLIELIMLIELIGGPWLCVTEESLVPLEDCSHFKEEIGLPVAGSTICGRPSCLRYISGILAMRSRAWIGFSGGLYKSQAT